MAEIVLLVDDDPNLLTLVDYTFRQQGFETLTAENGSQALDLLEEYTPDLIITDVMMPVIDGFELCRRVRADQRWWAIPFIFLSARNTPDDRIAGLDLGADDYVVKPFDRRELVAKTRTILNRVRIYREQVEASPQMTSSPSPAVQDAETAHRSRNAQVLVVDDDEPMRMLVAVKLKNAGFTVTMASNGREALDTLDGYTPDLIISDVIMPEMDGIELRENLLERRQFRAIPFLFLTAKGQADDMIEGLRLGVDDYITKPIGPDVLVQKARNLIQKHRETADKYREELEQAARRVSVHLEPDPPAIDGMSVSHRCVPLEIRGGDYYDYLPLDDGRVVAVIGDVMGKKWGAWFFSVAYIAYMRSVIRSTGAGGGSPSVIIHAINQLLWEDLKISEVFTTLLIAIIDPAARSITYSSAGHHPPLHLHKSDGSVVECSEGGVILGVQPDQVYPEHTVHLAPGDAFLCYSDGITEARNENGDMLGTQQLIRELTKAEHASAKDLVKSVFSRLEAFVGESRFEDDCTVLAIMADPA